MTLSSLYPQTNHSNHFHDWLVITLCSVWGNWKPSCDVINLCALMIRPCCCMITHISSSKFSPAEACKPNSTILLEASSICHKSPRHRLCNKYKSEDCIAARHSDYSVQCKYKWIDLVGHSFFCREVIVRNVADVDPYHSLHWILSILLICVQSPAPIERITRAYFKENKIFALHMIVSQSHKEGATLLADLDICKLFITQVQI